MKHLITELIEKGVDFTYSHKPSMNFHIISFAKSNVRGISKEAQFHGRDIDLVAARSKRFLKGIIGESDLTDEELL